ncbi:MAG: hypothetical protein IJK34_00590 [Clostridia bacterium]|nr:hypothetical protein [Clostridia bacterium]
MFVCLTEALKNIKTNFLLNAAIVVMIVSIMTFLGIVTLQIQIRDITTEVVLEQEAFVELSQYRFLIDKESSLRLGQRYDIVSGKYIPEEETFLFYPLSKNPEINRKYLENADKVWDFVDNLNSLQGVFYYTIKQGSFLSVGQHDAYDGHYVPDNTIDYAVTMFFFNIENLTLLKGRLPKEDDFYVDENGVQVVPVLVGYNLRNQFSLGDIVTVKDRLKHYDPNDITMRIVDMPTFSNGIVVGILDKSNVTTSSNGNSLLNFSTSIIRAVKDPSPNNFPDLKNNDNAYIYAAFNKLMLLPSSKLYINRTDEARIVEEINNALKDSGLDAFYSIARCDSYAKITASLEKERTETYLHVALLVGILCIFSLGILILMLNIANEKDYSIHRLVGATKNNVALMTTVQMFILLIVSDVLIHYPYILQATGLFLNGDSMIYIFNTGKIYTVIAVMNIIILALTYIISRIYASATDIVTSIKDNE